MAHDCVSLAFEYERHLGFAARHQARQALGASLVPALQLRWEGARRNAFALTACDRVEAYSVHAQTLWVKSRNVADCYSWAGSLFRYISMSRQ